MGGINHQPCRAYLKESTQLSRSVSLARSAMELANVGLEDLLLAELGGSIGSCDHMVQQLGSSIACLRQADVDIDALTLKMEDSRFEDLPTLKTIDFKALGTKLVANGMVSAEAWEQVMSRARDGGFRSVLAAIKQMVQALATRSETLLTAMEALHPVAASSTVNVIMEENRPGNLRVTFAQLYSAWSTFTQFFLASSMSSTEQWYVYMGYGGLVGQPMMLPAGDPAMMQAMA